MNKVKNLILIALAGIIVVGCGKKSAEQKAETAIPVLSDKVISKTVSIMIESFGQLSADNSVDIKAQVSGEILKTHFSGGQSVNKGDLLVEIDPSTYEVQLENDQAALMEAEADHKLKKYYVDVNSKLAEKSVMAAQEFEKLKAELVQSEANIKVNEAKVKLDKINLNRCKIHSPIDGIVGLSATGAGNVISENESLLQINKINPIWVDFSMPESNLLRLQNAIRQGKLVVKIYISSLNDEGSKRAVREYQGELNYLNNQANSSGSTISLSASISNDKEVLLPGQYATVKLILGEKENAIMAPLDSVKVNSNGKYVYKINSENRVEFTSVETGKQYGKDIEILSKDIKPGDNLVTVGHDRLNNNSLVKSANS